MDNTINFLHMKIESRNQLTYFKIHYKSINSIMKYEDVRLGDNRLENIEVILQVDNIIDIFQVILKKAHDDIRDNDIIDALYKTYSTLEDSSKRDLIRKALSSDSEFNYVNYCPISKCWGNATAESFYDYFEQLFENL